MARGGDTAAANTAALEGALTRLDLRRLAILGLLCNATLGVLGAIYAEAKPGSRLGWAAWFRHLPFGLNDEWTIPAFYSGLLLLFAAAAAALNARESGRPVDTWTVRGLALLFAFMGVDEVVSIHERLEAWTGVAWLRLYSPLILAGAIGWLIALRRLRVLPWAALAWIGGGVAWGIAQVIEYFQYDHGHLVHRWSILPEEVLEMTGSLLFGLVLLAWLQHRHAADDPETEAAGARVAG